MSRNVVIVDYGTGNLHSVKKCLDRLKVASIVSSERDVIRNCDRILLPGVGHFGRAMSTLSEMNLIDSLYEAVLIRRRPVLGICLGMELMASKGEEGDCAGLGWIHGKVARFGISDRQRFKVPNIGWSRIIRKKESKLLRNIAETAEFYFVHSYCFAVDNPGDVLSETRYEKSFVSAVEHENIFGVQFHPEKSFDAGARLIKNFIDI